MKERPILFSSSMVKAILEGRKTQTRRIVKPQPVFDPPLLKRCPYGSHGDRLWVKESVRRSAGPPDSEYDYAEYVADGVLTPLDTWPWKRDQLPSMFMPRGLSRITLEVTGVRVERLHDLSEEDAKAEGVGLGYRSEGGGFFARDSARAAFEILWKEINGAESWDANPWVWCIEFRPLPDAGARR